MFPEPVNFYDENESMEIVEVLVDEILTKVWNTVKQLKRWRKGNPENWAINIAKKRRAEGLPYKLKHKSRPAKKPKQVNCLSCKFKCTELFSESDRNNICRHYWNLDFKGQKNFILANVAIQQPKRVLAIRNQRMQRSFTKKCFLTKSGETVQVCQNFFCKTVLVP